MRRHLDLTLIPILLLGSSTTALAQDAEVPDVEHPAYLEQQRQSDEADQRAREQMQRDAQQREDNYNQALAATQRPNNSPAPSRSPGYAPAPAHRTVGTARLDPSDPAGAALQRGDYATAFRLTHDAAVRDGYLNAMKNLGNLYERGLGTRTNPQLAVQWYRSCADLGAAICQAELARVYYTGVGVSRDPVEAYKWLLIAGRPGGFKPALVRQNTEWQGQNAAAIRQNSAVMRNSLSYAQLSEATRRYQLWTPSDSVHPPELAAPQRHR